jgi:Raf kinase inhibitor-like YbhB/YbcL family protein
MERLIGRLLRGVHGHDRHLAWNAPSLASALETIALSSPAFAEGQPMPLRCAGAGVGDNLSPPLAWSGVPAGLAELLLIVEDPDAPLPRPVLHLLVTGIAPSVQGFDEGALSHPSIPGAGIGRGSFGRLGYAGPRPVQGHGPHRYVFQIFALGRPLALPQGPARLGEVLKAAAGTVLARGRLTGTYERP